MTTTNRLRNYLIGKIQRLSIDQLTELNRVLGAASHPDRSKHNTLKLAGSWKDLGEDFWDSLTDNLHETRAQDRPIQ
ncbi:MAG: hypothetical protein NW241_12330 [Bacteroidia bacterium]|nr:hypothetical protein [Bacteroidia bacterium]